MPKLQTGRVISVFRKFGVLIAIELFALNKEPPLFIHKSFDYSLQRYFFMITVKKFTE
jgi:hypothetical protein